MSNAIIENDMAAARTEARGQYGSHANAEELIRAHAASISPEVRSASRKPLNEEATKSLDRGSIEVPEGGKLVDAVVRGNTISYVWEDANGGWHKGATGYDDSYEAAADDPATQIVHEQTKQQVAERDASIDWRAEMDEKLGEMRSELEAEHAQKLADLREEHASEIEKLREEQDKEVETKAETKKSGGTSRAKTATRRTGGARKKAGTAKSQMARQQNERKVNEG